MGYFPAVLQNRFFAIVLPHSHACQDRMISKIARQGRLGDSLRRPATDTGDLGEGLFGHINLLVQGA